MLSPQAHIHPDAKIGSGVKVDPFAIIQSDVEIGDDTFIGPHAMIMSGTRIGKNCKIFPGAVVGAVSQDLKDQGGFSEVIIGNNTTLREYVTVNKSSNINGKTIIKDNVLLMAYCHVAHDCIVGNHVIMTNSCQIAGHVEIGDHARLAGGILLQQFTKVGESAFISVGCVGIKDIPPYVRTARDPLVYVGINTVGLSRRGLSAETIAHIADMYRVIYNRGLLLSQALDALKADFPPTKERDNIIHFIEKSEHGIVKRFSSSAPQE